MKKDYPLKDYEYQLLDDELYTIIQKLLDINYPLNSDPNLFDWYCNIRNKLAKKIHDKKLVAKILQKSK